MLHATPALTLLPSPADDVVAFAVDLVVDRGDAPRVAVRSSVTGGVVDVVNVEDAGTDVAGRRQVRFLVEADRGAVEFAVRVIVALDGVEQTIAGPVVAARA